MNLSHLSPLFPHDILTVAAIILGGGVVAVAMYTYAYDYAMCRKRK